MLIYNNFCLSKAIKHIAFLSLYSSVGRACDCKCYKQKSQCPPFDPE